MDYVAEIPDELVSTDLILGWLTEQVRRRRKLPEEIWLDASFKLNLLSEADEHEMEVMRQGVAQKKLEILKVQEKRNVAAADLEIEATDDYRLMREQEHKVERIKEFVRIAKINGNKF